MNTAFSRVSAEAKRVNREKCYALYLTYSSGDLGELTLYMDSLLVNEVREAVSALKVKNDGRFLVKASFDSINWRSPNKSSSVANVEITVQYSKPSMIPVDPAEIDAIVLDKLKAALDITLEKTRAEIRRRENDEAACNVANAVNSKISVIAREKCDYSKKIAALREELKAAKDAVSEGVWQAAYAKYGAEVCDIARTKKPDPFSASIELLGG